jgi:hypothetical protein
MKMKTVSLCILTIMLSIILSAQSDVDKLVRTLDSLTMSAVDNWKISPDLKGFNPGGDPTGASYNDSLWKNLRLNEKVYLDSCWIRKEIVMPEKILGSPVGGPMRFVLEVDDYGYLWINGESKGKFLWDGNLPFDSPFIHKYP